MSTVLDLCLQRTVRPGDSCINQLIAIYLSIFKGFDGGLEVRSIFLEKSKAFTKVWVEGLIYKLRPNGICDNLSQLFTSFLDRRKQQNFLNVQC